jgi:uncharacterized lipoprotein YddW (UPF0748 family)
MTMLDGAGRFDWTQRFDWTGRSLKPRNLWPLLFLAALMIVLWAGIPVPAGAQSSRSEIRGVWMTSIDSDVLMDQGKLRTAVDQLSRLNFNTVYPVIWNAGYVLYPSAIAQQAGIQTFVRTGNQGHDTLADLMTQGHRQGLLVIPWFEFGFMAPPTSELALNHPDWMTERRDGSQTWVGAPGEVLWLNPFHPEVQELITQLVVEVVTQYDADGIQFDDNMGLPNEFGYDPYTVALYQKENKGKSPPANPQDPGWVKWRADKLTAFMVRLHKAVKARKPNAIFSVSPNPYDYAYKVHLQDWLSWVRRGIVDELIVQLYRPDLESFVSQMNRPEIQAAQQKIPTGVGILTGLRQSPVPIARIASQVQAARDRGLGVSFFFFESLWNSAVEPTAERQAQFQALFPTPQPRNLPNR